MKNPKQVLLLFVMIGWVCAILDGCNKYTNSPQFVVVSRTMEKDVLKVYPLFAFDINTDGSCLVSYIGTSGRVLCSVKGVNLPTEVIQHYKIKLENRRCSGEATICAFENGQIRLTQEELMVLSMIISVAPPDNLVLKDIHPTILSVFKGSINNEREKQR